MARFVLAACLALCFAAAAVAAPECTKTLEQQAATLKDISPKGCLNDEVTVGVPAKCFNDFNMNVTNSTGAGCTSTFSVAFKDKTECDLGVIGNGTVAAPAKAGGDGAIKGEFVTGNTFKGTLSPAGKFIVTVDGVKCQLTYDVKTTTKAKPITAEEEATAAAPAAAAAAAPAAAAPAPAKSAAAVAAPAAALAAVAAVAALLL